jgi:hypothetical protein
MEDTSTIKRVQGRLGVKDDGVPGKETFTALSLAVGVEPGKYTREELVLAIQQKAGLEVNGIADAIFWNELLNFLDRKDAEGIDDAGEFYTLEIPKARGTIADSAPLMKLAVMLCGPLLAKLRGGLKSKGTFTTGMTSLVGGVALLWKGLMFDDAEMSTTMVIGGVTAIIQGIGLMMARDTNVSDEQAGAKKLKL